MRNAAQGDLKMLCKNTERDFSWIQKFKCDNITFFDYVDKYCSNISKLLISGQ